MYENKYLTIYHDLAEKIRQGHWKPYDKLPSENELVERYHTSRETIRKALNLLSEHGYIQKMKGKGSIVLDVGKYDFPVSGLVSFKELAQNMKQPVKTIVNELEIIKPDPYLKRYLHATNKDEIWKVIRSREIEGERIILDKDFFYKKYVPTLTREICEDSIYEYLEKRLKLKISFAKKEMTVEKVNDEDRKYLDLNGYDHIVVVKNFVYLDDATLFQYTESRHRLDKFRFVDFARRK
ncbi:MULTISPECIES: trehalose operon repressor [Parageobacillus]|uniref:Trehalose operon repressor n=1 Tax=Parageobacillus thermoglucosidasius TaxID=1426 RepID=A0A1B7KV90_PARTM|nr:MULTISPECIES: trehalose operon repressor [Parageobacillus]OAT73973.1 trehalose operon repressor [Parageobacillus thermoglucosidasius]BDG47310.1 trehalose operon repressor [Parageobacillus sp. KH3-4]